MRTSGGQHGESYPRTDKVFFRTAGRAWLAEIEHEQKANAAIEACWGQGGRRDPTWRNWRPLRRSYSTTPAATFYRQRAERLKGTPEWKVREAARRAVRKVIEKGWQKSRRTHELLGCTYEFARGYIEAKFRPGMTWENHGTVWEIDHRKPLAAFNLLDPAERAEAIHYSNLQPLFKEENRAKAARWEPAVG